MMVRTHCARYLEPHKIPRAILFVDALPTTVRGKTDQEALHALIRAHGVRLRD
jgi:acyl-coenzyme A synthetase/AMP-(fatty) acid ligase